LNVTGIGDEAANAFHEPLDVLEEAAADRVISAAELPLVLVAIRQLAAMRPALEELAVTLRAIAQLSKCGVTRFPLAPMRREIATLAEYRARFEGAEMPANVTAFRAKKSGNQLPTDAA
jgi:hypothetical protein